ncbi:MAG: RNA polymerase sigma factor [Thiogranum sp.]|jgi:RNA polymerase sigma-70 factor (ECF subfamily)
MTERVTDAGSDEELMRRYAQGDLQAFQRLYTRHRGGLYRYFLRQTSPSIAEELFQEVWARVIGSRRRYRATAAFRTWLYTLAHHRLVDHWRREGVRAAEVPQAEDDDPQSAAPDPGAGPHTLVDLRDCLEQLLQLVAGLPERQRQTFLLRHEAGLPLAEIAAAMNAGVETVKSRLRYAMDRLRSAIASECLEEG